MGVDIVPWLQLGLGGGMLVVLYVGLARGKIHTEASVEKTMEQVEKRMAEKDAYTKRLEELNDKLDERNEKLASEIGQVLEIAKANGLLQALPPPVRREIQ